MKKKEKYFIDFCQNPTVIVGKKPLFKGSIYGRYYKNHKPYWWMCEDYELIDGHLPILIFKEKRWRRQLVDCTHPCYKWVKKTVEKLGRIPVVDKEPHSFKDVEQLMKTYSLHKKGTGSRINTNQINNPLKWNEVTQEAHWYGHGNASIVANGCRYR